MPTKRTPIRRQALARITPQIVELFKAADRHRSRYLRCAAGELVCKGKADLHCGDCRTFLDASVALRAALGRKPWQANPVDVESTGEPPDWVCATDWREAQQLRRAIQAAARQSRKVN